MKLSLSILALAAAASALSDSQQNVDSVRAKLKVPLSPDDLKHYSGIKATGTSGPFYENLQGIATPEDLIVAEFNGATYKPADDAGTIYLLSAGKGITATVSHDMAAKYESLIDGGMPVSGETKAQLEARYKSMSQSLSTEERDSLLDGVATAFLEWSSGVGNLDKRRNYICKKNGDKCSTTNDCKKFATIERKDCICIDKKCKTITV
ncbi:hypothetical protein C2857_002187 [Epichloe festucae Fl1]|uniref:Uncharacterized protein n=1 Tax=Epichloe festucae (strain Fl1) TaxID=877507 RepID=A0A7S9KUU4_EPIFF|nr:hypothetical protein C2857_002187 [Epichloe festucae Fl1]